MTLTCHAGHTGSFSVCLTGREIAMLSGWLLRLTSLLTLLSPRITFSALPQYRETGQVTALQLPPSHIFTSANISVFCSHLMR